MKRYLLMLTFGLGFSAVNAQFTTPNTGVKWTLDSIATHSPSTITKDGSTYLLHEDLYVSANDSLLLNTALTLKIEANKQIEVDGYFKSDASLIKITAIDTAQPFKGFRFNDPSTAYFNNTEILYGGGLRVITANFEMYNSEVSNQSSGVSTGGAISFSKGSPIVMFSVFENNDKPALSSAANAQVSAHFEGNYFEGNNRSNGNAPQINMGPSGTADSIRIINNMVIGDRSLTRVGGISASSLVGVPNRIVIKGNVVRDNRYGITSMGPSSGIIEGNIIEDNDTEGDPNLGGSGINLFSTDMVYLRENQIRRNLWGLTLQGTAQVNLGSDTEGEENIGQNIFADNGNGGVVYALYNNTPNPVSALHNCWIEGQESTIEQVEEVIFHETDDSSLGLVSYDPFECGVEMSVGEVVTSKMKLYPNPAKSFFVIEGVEKGKVSIYNFNGQLLQSFENMKGGDALPIRLPKGVYLVKFENEKGKFSQKLMVE